MSKRRDSSDAMKQKVKKICVDKLACQKATERASPTSKKTTYVEKPELKQPLERIPSSRRKKIEPRQSLQQKQHEGKKAKTIKSSSADDHWKRNLYVRGLSTSTRIKDLQKHLMEKTGAEAIACSPVPGEPYYFKITMATSKDASKCLRLLNDTELFGKNMRFERKERAPEKEKEPGRSRSISFGKELKEFSLVVDKSHSRTKGPNSTDRRRSRSRDRDLTSFRPNKTQKMSLSKETKMRSKSREQSRERSRSPMKKRQHRKRSIYWDLPPFGYEYMTPMQYKAIQAQATPQTKGLLFMESTASTETIEMEDTNYSFPESIVHKLFINGLLNHLNQDHVDELLECERRYLEEKIQFENEREWQRIERQTLEREKIEMQRERERFEREQWIEREKIKAERKELKRLQARSIAKDGNAICAAQTTTQGTGQQKKLMSPVTDQRSILKACSSDHSKIEKNQ